MADDRNGNFSRADDGDLDSWNRIYASLPPSDWDPIPLQDDDMTMDSLKLDLRLSTHLLDKSNTEEPPLKRQRMTSREKDEEDSSKSFEEVLNNIESKSLARSTPSCRQLSNQLSSIIVALRNSLSISGLSSLTGDSWRTRRECELKRLQDQEEDDSFLDGNLSPLHYAMTMPAEPEVSTLHLNCPPGLYLHWSRTPLHLALAKQAPLETINEILACYPQSSHWQDVDGMTPFLFGLKHNASVEVLNAVLRDNPDAIKFKDKQGMSALHWGINVGAAKETIHMLLEADPAAVEVLDDKGRSPLHCMTADLCLHSILYIVSHNPGCAELRDASNTTPLLKLTKILYESSSTGDKDVLDLETKTFRKLVEAFPHAVNLSDITGASPMSMLVEQCSKDLERHIEPDKILLQRLRIMMPGMINGQPFRPLCQSKHRGKLRAFLSLFSHDSRCIYPLIDLNQSEIPGWTILEIMADLDCGLLYQIVKNNFNAITSFGGVAIRCRDAYNSQVQFCPRPVVTDATLLKVAHRAMLCKGSLRLALWGRNYLRKVYAARVECLEDVMGTMDKLNARISKALGSPVEKPMRQSAIMENIDDNKSWSCQSDISSFHVHFTRQESEMLTGATPSLASTERSSTETLPVIGIDHQVPAVVQNKNPSKQWDLFCMKVSGNSLPATFNDIGDGQYDKINCGQPLGKITAPAKKQEALRPPVFHTSLPSETPAPDPKTKTAGVTLSLAGEDSFPCIDFPYRRTIAYQPTTQEKVQLLIRLYKDVDGKYQVLKSGCRRMYFRAQKVVRCVNGCWNGDVEKFCQANPTLAPSKFGDKCKYPHVLCSTGLPPPFHTPRTSKITIAQGNAI